MIEPLFGSNAGNWAGMSSPGFGWFQPGISSRPAPFGASGFGAQQPNPQGTAGVSMPVPPVLSTFRAAWEPSVSASPYAPLPQPFGFASGLTTAVQPGTVFGPAPAVFGLQSVAPLVGQEFPGGVTASAILAAVAIRRGQPMGPTTDQELEEFLYDALELLPGTSEVDVRCEGGRTTLTGSVPHKRLKHDIGEIAWAIPHINDVQNNVTIATRRRSRSAQRENEPVSTPAPRKQG
jgi:hypothetical protein